jgi:hypothetical protein
MKAFKNTVLAISGLFLVLSVPIAGQQIADLGRNNPFTPNPSARTFTEIRSVAQAVPSSEASAEIKIGAANVNTSTNSTRTYLIGTDDVLRIDGLDGSGEAIYVTATVEGSFLPGLEKHYFFVGKTAEAAESELSTAVGSPSVRVSVRQYASNYVLVSSDEAASYRLPLMRSAVPLYLILAQMQTRRPYPYLHITRGDGSSEILPLAEHGSEDKLIFSGDRLRFSRSKD